ncbi:MAG TPA: hypothetical protein VMS30_00440, partial [Phycisphaerales bacterium]|nr:hypothetical protein [Phycisphaerales bacterium]
EDIMGAQIHWDGTVTHAAYGIDTSGTNDFNPTVSTMIMPSKQYMVAYEENGSFIFARALTGTTINTGANLTSLEGAFPSEHAWAPVLDAIDGKFIMAYNQTFPAFPDADANVSTYCTATGVIRVAEGHRALAWTLQEDDQLALASTYATGGSSLNREGLVSWTHRSGSYGEIMLAEYQGHASCCKGDIAPAGGNGVIDVNDLLAVIAAWGNVSGTPAADINGDFAVDVNDLLAVITSWGPCL